MKNRKKLFSMFICIVISFTAYMNAAAGNELDSLVSMIDKAQNNFNEASYEVPQKRLFTLLKASPENFLLHYYMGLCDLNLAVYYYQNNNYTKFKEKLSNSVVPIKKCIELNSDFADGFVLLAQYYSYLILTDSYNMASVYNAKIQENISIARTIEPSNPRIYLLQGINSLYTPEGYGGSVNDAKESLNRAVQLFQENKSKSSDPVYPHWGYEETYVWLGKIAEIENDMELAKDYYRKSLLLNSDYSWSRYHLDLLENKSGSGYSKIILLTMLLIVSLLIVFALGKRIRTKYIN